MATTYPFRLVTLEGELFKGKVVSISAPGQQGSFGVLSGHAGMVAALVAGQLDITEEDDKATHYVISGGVCEVRSDETLIMAQKAQPVSGPAEVRELLATSYATK